jgi:hypothetical protein
MRARFSFEAATTRIREDLDALAAGVRVPTTGAGDG